ncbi:response regulator [Exilibacterium tricleocarpae]|uniref:Response regulator n=1 Tax=Exilibacterium tricleocarpae TaxID=2591008 RepID=A0A545U6M0_9GAMM|nr:winged helix-turn-helix domain-containing protein [Exilibacterium tricleocarpae]TQV85115.1 response regulator [Exilibacterium tricleocarpae]
MKSSDAAAIRLFLVEDDAGLSALVQEYFTKKGFAVAAESDGITAARRILEEKPDVVILDVMLPGITGMEICRRVRPAFSGLILMLTALDDDMDQMLGLELGADDYVVKPVVPRLLLSRIHALLRRTPVNRTPQPTEVSADDQLAVGDLCINRVSRTLAVGSSPIKLTTAEFELLWVLAEAAGKVVNRDTILQRIRGLDYDGLDRSIDRRISRLRKKLGDDPDNPKRIKTVRGKGYILCP